MRDSKFKNFDHCLKTGDKIASRGKNIATNGNYRPDIAVKNSSGKIYLILESERKSDRKAFIGAMVHAAKYAAESNLNITLVFVMKETGNQTTVKQISDNIRAYFQWLHSLGATNLQCVYLISDKDYVTSAKSNEEILSAAFIKRCTAL